MRPADINRAKKALEHIKAAQTLIHSIKWENLTGQDYALKQTLDNHLLACQWSAEDFIRIGGGEV